MDILSDVLAALRTGRPTSVRTEAKAPFGLEFPPTPGAGFHVVLDGHCTFEREGQEAIPLGPGDLMFKRGGKGHVLYDDPASPRRPFLPERIMHDSPMNRFVVEGDGPQTRLLCGAYHLDMRRPHPLLAELPEVMHIPARPGRHPALRSAIDQLATELDHPRPGSDAVVTSLVDLLLLYIFRAWYEEQAAERSSGWAVALTDPLIAPSLRAIHEAPGHPWTVESLGERVGLSRAAFARRFAAVVGEPPLTYLTTWRMTTAARLLRQTDVSLGTIALQTGYTSEFAFAKAFKRQYGVPPGSYRRQVRAA